MVVGEDGGIEGDCQRIVNTKRRVRVMLINKTNIAWLAIASSLWSQIAVAETVEVKSVVTKFEPTVVFIKPGDSVKFTNMAGHDTVAIEGMIPEGAEPWKSAMNEEFSVTLDKEGAYVHKCTPHVGNGMVGAIVVGEVPPANLEAIKKSPENKGMIGRAVRQLEKEVEAHK
jgi:pseudoazurin